MGKADNLFALIEKLISKQSFIKKVEKMKDLSKLSDEDIKKIWKKLCNLQVSEVKDISVMGAVVRYFKPVLKSSLKDIYGTLIISK